MNFLDEKGLETLVSSIRDKYDVEGGGGICASGFPQGVVNGTFVKNDTYLGQQLFSLQGNSSSYLDSLSFDFYPHVGEWYTLSYFAKANKNNVTIMSYFYPQINGHDNMQSHVLTTEWQLIKRHLYISSVGSDVQHILPVRLSVTDATIYYTYPVFELGKVAHPTLARISPEAINSLF